MDNKKFTSNFNFLEQNFPILSSLATASEYHLYNDSVVALIKLRQFGESITEILYKEHGLEFPTNNTFHNRLNGLNFENILPLRVKDLLFTIKSKGNIAVHRNEGSLDEAKTAIFSAFKIGKWFEETYGTSYDLSSLKYSLPPNLDARHALNELESEFKQLEIQFNTLIKEREIKEISSSKAKEIKEKSDKAALKIEMSEAETREIIDEKLRQAGWEADTNNLNYKLKRTLPDRKRKIAIAEWRVGNKWADYALFIGNVLYGIVEAKKYALDIPSDLTQSKKYAELAEEKNEAKLLGNWRNYKVPFLFSTNGRPYLEQIKTKSGIWFLDVRDEYNQSRPLQGWFSPDGLKDLFERDIKTANTKLLSDDISYLKSKVGLGLRNYQIDAIEAVEQHIIEDDPNGKALLAMATGTGKTRTIIGLCYRLIKSNRFNRILFLVDRTVLAIQALNSFKDNKIEELNTLSDTYQVEDLKKAIPDIDTRLHFATVQGMVQRLFYTKEDSNILPIDTYDCIIIDEAHRGYLLDREMDDEELVFKNQNDYVSKYRKVLDYFDAYSIGMTATPALHTIEIFGKPVYNYSYREAVIDGFLVDHDPPHIIKTKLSSEGIKWEKGERPSAYDPESGKVIELDELEDELKIEIEGFNKLVITEPFNRTVCEQLVKQLDPDGDEKTLVFASRDDHADLVVQLLKEEFEKEGIDVGDDAILKITGKSYNPPQLVKRFKNEKYPTIVVTVDLLSTGVDVPPISNIVFLRRIKSRILYEQMLGRATRKCDEIGKEVFQIFDAVRLYEALQDFTNMKPIVTNPNTSFQQLSEELHSINSNERVKKQFDQIIAKLQRKKGRLSEEQKEKFNFHSEGLDPDNLISLLKGKATDDTIGQIIKFSGLWKYLDELKPQTSLQLVSKHKDKFIATERGYGLYSKKPKDYLDSFQEYINNNKNKIDALNIVCTRPRELDRKSLKELMLTLDANGYNSRTLHEAWKNVKNEDIAADIISYIRTLAVGDNLISHDERIKRAVDKIRNLNKWNKVQEKWITRFEEQLLKEYVLQKDDLNKEPFKSDGGYKRLNKIFNQQLDKVLETLNEYLYAETG